MRKGLLAFGSLVLGASLVLRLMPMPNRIGPAKGPHLEATIPSEVTGWKVDDEELGHTEAVNSTVDKQLRLDDFVFRSYSSGRLNFDVYVAYWGPGKMPVQMVASHTPDRCWTENGWQCTDMEFEVSVGAKGFDLKPAQVRSFQMDRQVRHVLYWHLVEGIPYNYGSRFNDIPHPGKWLTGFWSGLWEGQPEQYFIRLSTPFSFKELWREPAFLDVMDALSALGLKREAG